METVNQKKVSHQLAFQLKPEVLQQQQRRDDFVQRGDSEK